MVSPGARCLVGRSRACSLVLSNPTVSGEHAVIFRAFNDRWAVRDLGSRNGTWVGDAPVPAGEALELLVGDTVRFGNRTEPWVLVDDAAPGAGALSDDDRTRHALDDVLVLPDEDLPSAWVLCSNGRWFVERGEDQPVEALVDGQLIEAGGQRWRVFLPRGEVGAPLAATVGPSLGPMVSDITLEFDVSHDGSFVQIALAHRHERTSITPRACHRLVLLLARARLDDRGKGLPERDCGWVHPDLLQEGLDASPQKIHVDVLRCRRQLAALGVQDADELFERRSTTREIRLGVANLHVRALGADAHGR